MFGTRFSDPIEKFLFHFKLFSLVRPYRAMCWSALFSAIMAPLFAIEGLETGPLLLGTGFVFATTFLAQWRRNVILRNEYESVRTEISNDIAHFPKEWEKDFSNGVRAAVSYIETFKSTLPFYECEHPKAFCFGYELKACAEDWKWMGNHDKATEIESIISHVLPKQKLG